jgi:gluconate 2-dehydrogenase alpha chain
MAERVDAIIVGLGAAGGLLAEELTRAGMRVVALDKGADHSDEDFKLKHDEIRYFSRSAIVPHMGTDPITWRARDGETARVLPWAAGRRNAGDPFQIPPSIGTGGGTLHWGGSSWRFREADFRMRSTIVDALGEGALPEDTTLVDWPVSYQDLEPYYDRVEWELGISGAAGNVGGAPTGEGNPFEAPRRRGFPMPPLRPVAADERFRDACRRLGYTPFPQAAAIASEPFKDRQGCVYCGFCHGFPCHVRAKTSTQVTSVPAALATGNLDLRPHSRVFRVELDDDRRARGVSYFDADGRTCRLDADLVVLAGYALENARLLLVSGVNGNGEVGRHFMVHNYGWYVGVLPEATNPFMGPLVAGSAIDDLTSELVLGAEPGLLWGSPITAWSGDTQPIEAARNPPPGVPRWGAGLKRWLVEDYRRLFRLYSQTPTLPSRHHYCDLDPTVRDPYGQPALRITHDWSAHDVLAVEYLMRAKRRIGEEMGVRTAWEDPPDPAYHVTTHDVGTHRMGWDPATSVVDPYGRVHECEGLYAVGGGQFPTLAAYNPTQTIQALAYLSADRLLGRV